VALGDWLGMLTRCPRGADADVDVALATRRELIGRYLFAERSNPGRRFGNRRSTRLARPRRRRRDGARRRGSALGAPAGSGDLLGAAEGRRGSGGRGELESVVYVDGCFLERR
jgi:hypothetical protein